MNNRISSYLILACLVSAGCSTPNANPPIARANTGYIDFYTDQRLDLSWEVKREKQPGAGMQTVFADFNPIQATVLRVAAPPGTHRFQLQFANKLTKAPETFSVPVSDGKVTPVHVTLTPMGSEAVVKTTSKYVPSGRATRKQTQSSAQETTVFQIGAIPGTPQPYQPKEQMPYWSSETK